MVSILKEFSLINPMQVVRALQPPESDSDSEEEKDGEKGGDDSKSRDEKIEELLAQVQKLIASDK